MNPRQILLLSSDEFEFYKKVIGRVLGAACLYSQVIKTRRNDRIVKGERRMVIGGAWGLQQALRDSEDSSTLNTSFVERLNLTTRLGSTYLFRRTNCQAGWRECLADHPELFQCCYNFISQASPGAKIRTRGSDTSPACGIDPKAVDVQGDLFLDDAFWDATKCQVRVFRLGPVSQCGQLESFYGGLTTLCGGSTLRNEPSLWNGLSAKKRSFQKAAAAEYAVHGLYQ